ncbi:MAG: DUF99 family protein [Methanomassiliicoccales archaeon]|nr:MAG: DUF99 family protein [Methanomassiliicoccales archaeon]
MKSQIRVLGIDDSPFRFDDKKTWVVGVVMRVPSYIEAVLKTEVEVDGIDASEKLTEMINSSRYKEQLKLVMLDGVALGGFNVVDIKELYEKIKLPIVTITREEPNFAAMESALKEHFDDWQKRLDVIRKGELIVVETQHKPIYVKFIGMDLEELKTIIELSTVRGALPEAIRVAHLIASGVAMGESYGRA